MKATYTLTVEDNDKPEGVPAVTRFRQWLKVGLRRFGLKCTSAVEGPVCAEGLRLRGIVNGLADRVARQSELLTGRAERQNSK